MNKVTIQDIAKELELSRNTVAKALNDGVVAQETRLLVIKKAKDMGYGKLKPSHLALIEEKKDGGIILVLFNRAESVFWNRLLTGISDEAKENNYRMQLHIVEEGDQDGSETLKLIHEKVKGILFLCSFPDSFVEGLKEAEAVKTFFNAPEDPSAYLEMGNVVTLEGKYAVKRLAEKAMERGARTFGFIGHSRGSYNIQARLDGLLLALREKGIRADERLLITDREKSSYYTYSMVEQMVESMPYIPDAIVCVNDDVAKLAAGALLKLDRAKAETTIFIGFDNTAEWDFFQPDIMTVEVHKEEVGRRLVRATLDQIWNPRLDHAIITAATYPVLNQEGDLKGWKKKT